MKEYFYKLFKAGVVLLMMLMVGSGCATRKKCEMLFPCPEPTIETIKEPVYLPPLIFTDTFEIPPSECDTFIREIFRNRVVMDTTTKLQLRYWYDEANRLRVECERLPDTIERTVTLTKYVDRSPEPDAKFTPWWVWAIISVLVLFLFLALRRR